MTVLTQASKIILGCFICFTLSLATLAGEEPLSSKSFTNWNFDIFTSQQEQCVRTILTHPITHGVFPGLLNPHQSNGEVILREMNLFCDCKVRRLLNSYKLKEKQPIAYRFRDKAISYEVTDHCASNILSSKTLALQYAITVSTILHDDLINRLEGRTPAFVRSFTAYDALQEHLQCVHSAIMNRCTKIKSLRHTFICIRATTADPISMDDFNKNCPTLSNSNHHFLSDLSKLPTI